MKTSSLAERLEIYEAQLGSFDPPRAPLMRRVMAPDAPPAAKPARRPRRSLRARTIETRDQGLRLFRVS